MARGDAVIFGVTGDAGERVLFIFLIVFFEGEPEGEQKKNLTSGTGELHTLLDLYLVQIFEMMVKECKQCVLILQ